MSDKNKVLFGFKDLYIGTYEVVSGEVVLGTPYHQAGAVGFSPAPSNDAVDFYADDIDYYAQQTTGPRSGDLEVAKFDDDFKTQFLGYKRATTGGVAEVINPVKPSVYIMFEIDGDKEHRRIAMYNGTLGGIEREYSTKEGSNEPVTEKLPAKFVGDAVSGMMMQECKPDEAGYDTFFSNPQAPELESE